MKGYEISTRKQSVEVMTSKRIQCPACRGGELKFELGKWCKKCDGEGTIIKHEMTYELVEQPGDPAQLQIALKAIDSIKKLSGLDAPVKKQIKKDVKSSVLSAHMVADSSFLNIPPEIVHNAMADLYEWQQNNRGSSQQVIEGEVLGDDDGDD